MRILNLNIWGGMLYEPLIDYLAAADADVLCLQEVARAPGAVNDWLTYRDGAVVLKQRAHLYDEIAAALPDHDGFFCPAMRGELEDGNTTAWQDFGLATFVRKDLAVIGQALDFIHGRYSPSGFGEHPRARNAHGIRLFDKRIGAPVTVVQFHGLRETTGKGDSPARAAQAEALMLLIEQVWERGERLVVCGDFNLLPDSQTFAILGRLGLSDLVTAGGFTDTRTSYYSKSGRYADYMLVTPEVVVKTFDVVCEPEVSDHRALQLDLG